MADRGDERATSVANMLTRDESLGVRTSAVLALPAISLIDKLRDEDLNVRLMAVDGIVTLSPLHEFHMKKFTLSVIPKFRELSVVANRLFARWHKADSAGGNLLLTGSEFEECFRILDIAGDVKDVREVCAKTKKEKNGSFLLSNLFETMGTTMLTVLTLFVDEDDYQRSCLSLTDRSSTVRSAASNTIVKFAQADNDLRESLIEVRAKARGEERAREEKSGAEGRGDDVETRPGVRGEKGREKRRGEERRGEERRGEESDIRSASSDPTYSSCRCLFAMVSAASTQRDSLGQFVVTLERASHGGSEDAAAITIRSDLMAI
eukprot:763520-Hanusia_phi.AAC.1